MQVKFLQICLSINSIRAHVTRPLTQNDARRPEDTPISASQRNNITHKMSISGHVTADYVMTTPRHNVRVMSVSSGYG